MLEMGAYLFKVVLEEDETEDGRPAFSAHCPALPGCNSWGLTQEEALKNINEAAELYLESLRAHGEPIPVDPEKGTIEIGSPAVLVNV